VLIPNLVIETVVSATVQTCYQDGIRTAYCATGIVRHSPTPTAAGIILKI